MNINAAFQWECQPKAEKLILDLIDRACQANSTIAKLGEDLLHLTSTRLCDWLDYVSAAESNQVLHDLQESGFVQQGNGHHRLFAHPGAQLPRVLLQKSGKAAVGLAVVVDSIADFLLMRGESRPVEGSIFGNFRRCHISQEQGADLWVVEKGEH